MLRPGSWSRPAGASPVRVSIGAPGSRPRFVVERRRAERGVKSLFVKCCFASEGASVRAVVPSGASPAASSQLQRESRAGHVTAKAYVRAIAVPDSAPLGSSRSRGSGTYTRFDSEQERSVCARLGVGQETGRISRW